MSVTYFIYNILILTGGFLLTPYWFYKLITEKKQRVSVLAKIGIYSKSQIPPSKKKTIWIHAVSVGEVNAALPLIDKIKAAYPDYNLTLSTITATGNKLAKEKLSSNGINIIFFPFDFKWPVKKSIDDVRPSLCIIFETELWPNFLRELKSRNIPCLIANGRISSRSFKRYHALSWFMKDVLYNVTLFGMQSEMDGERIVAIGASPDKVRVCGNVKYEQSIDGLNKEEVNSIRDSIGIDRESRLLVAGSTHPGEEEIILETYGILLKQFSDLTLLIAPRHIERANEVAETVKRWRFIPVLRSESNETVSEADTQITKVFLLNTIGELTRIYGIADIVFMGGSLIPHGGQNILEPAYHRKPVLFGNYMDNFKDISREMIEAEGGFMVSNRDELCATITNLLLDTNKMKLIGQNGYNVIMKNRGALRKNMDMIREILPYG